MTPMAEGFLAGVVATASLIGSLFFLKFWKRTRDALFLAFALTFLIEAATRIAALFLEHPNEASPWFYVARMVAYLAIVVAIVRKNYA